MHAVKGIGYFHNYGKDGLGIALEVLLGNAACRDILHQLIVRAEGLYPGDEVVLVLHFPQGCKNFLVSLEALVAQLEGVFAVIGVLYNVDVAFGTAAYGLNHGEGFSAGSYGVPGLMACSRGGTFQADRGRSLFRSSGRIFRSRSCLLRSRSRLLGRHGGFFGSSCSFFWDHGLL